MTKPRKTLFISDLHLEESRPDITEQFLSLLKTAETSVDALYILGDLFEVWIGDDDHSDFHRQIMSALKAVTSKGIPVYILHGNRDFLLGKRFMHETGCTLLPDEEKISVYGTPVLLMHGDTLCTRDTAYIKARKRAHNKFIQFLFLSLPLKYRKKIADNMRAKSKNHTQSTPMEIMDVTQEEVIRVMRKHHVQYLVHGHTHRPAMHPLFVEGKPATRIVLDAWHDHGSCLEWDETGKKTPLSLLGLCG